MRSTGSSQQLSKMIEVLCSHRVQGRVLFPGTAFFELAAAAASSSADDSLHGSLVLSGVSISAPRVLESSDLQSKSSTGDRQMSDMLQCELDSDVGDLVIRSSSKPAAAPHVRCRATRIQGKENLPTQQHPQAASSTRLWHPALRKPPAQQLKSPATTAVLGPLQQPTAVGAREFIAHPAQADCVLHLGAVPQNVRKQASETSRVPVGVAALSAHRPPAHAQSFDAGWALAHPAIVEKDGIAVSDADWMIMSTRGRLAVRGLQAKAIAAPVSIPPSAAGICEDDVLHGLLTVNNLCLSCCMMYAAMDTDCEALLSYDPLTTFQMSTY